MGNMLTSTTATSTGPNESVFPVIKSIISWFYTTFHTLLNLIQWQKGSDLLMQQVMSYQQVTLDDQVDSDDTVDGQD